MQVLVCSKSHHLELRHSDRPECADSHAIVRIHRVGGGGADAVAKHQKADISEQLSELSGGALAVALDHMLQWCVSGHQIIKAMISINAEEVPYE